MLSSVYLIRGGDMMLRAALLAFTLVVACVGYLISEGEDSGPPLSLLHEPEVVAEPVSVPPAAVVVLLPQRVDPSRPPVELLPRPPDGPLARQVQQELQRVGCYDRELNGIWTTSSRVAAQDFMHRVNARLPIDKPDEVLLSLLQNQIGVVCSKPCPSDQSIDALGRCSLTSTKGAGQLSPSEKASPLVTGSISGPPRSQQPSSERVLAGSTNPPAQLATAITHVQIAHAALVQDRTATDARGARSSHRPMRNAPSTPTRYWRSFMRSVDRAFGF